MKLLLVFVFICTFSSPIIASNEERELRLVQEVLAGIVDGEAIFFTTDQGRKFLALYTKTDVIAKGAIIILHGRGFHANWQNVTQPVRTILPEFGWDTLSLQMPVLNKDAEFNDYAEILSESPPRIDKAIETLKTIGYKKIIILSHSCGGQMMLQWLKQQPNPDLKIDALINVSLGMDNYKRINGHYPPLNKAKVPILDIYGSEDIVKPLALTRWNLIRQGGHDLSRQIEVEGADHMFIDKGEVLTQHINQWLITLN